MIETKLSLKNITFTYGEGTPFEIKALQDVNLNIKAGMITGIIGHTGSGKSTLVQMLNGLLKPSAVWLKSIYLIRCARELQHILLG